MQDADVSPCRGRFTGWQVLPLSHKINSVSTEREGGSVGTGNDARTQHQAQAVGQVWGEQLCAHHAA